MDKYYYFVAQLPLLKFNQKPYISREAFLAEAAKWLTLKDFSLLSRTDIHDFSAAAAGRGVLEEYKEFETALRQELLLYRKAKGSIAEGKSRILNPALTEGNPLEVEQKLLKLRWEFIEEKEAGHHFDLDRLVLYFLKFQILERLFTFNREKGAAAFESLCRIEP